MIAVRGARFLGLSDIEVNVIGSVNLTKYEDTCHLVFVALSVMEMFV